MNAAQPGRMMLALLIVPGAGFIFLFLSAAIAMTFLQSIGLYSLVGDSRLTADHWLALLDKGFFDSFLFSLKVGVGSAFGTLLFAYPLALFLRRKRFGSRSIRRASLLEADVGAPFERDPFTPPDRRSE